MYVYILNQLNNIPYWFPPCRKKKVKEKSWGRKAWEGTIILNRLYCYCLIKIMKCSGVGATEAGGLHLAFPFWFCSFCRRHAPSWGEVQAHKPRVSLDRFGYRAKETVFTNQLFPSEFLTFQSPLRCAMLGVPRINLFGGLWGGWKAASRTAPEEMRLDG